MLVAHFSSCLGRSSKCKGPRAFAGEKAESEGSLCNLMSAMLTPALLCWFHHVLCFRLRGTDANRKQHSSLAGSFVEGSLSRTRESDVLYHPSCSFFWAEKTWMNRSYIWVMQNTWDTVLPLTSWFLLFWIYNLDLAIDPKQFKIL